MIANHLDSEFEDCDIDAWGDAEEMDEILNQHKTDDKNNNTSSATSSNENKESETTLQRCWICTKCETINNLKLTFEKYNMHCGACESIYLPNKTQIIMMEKWDDPHLDMLDGITQPTKIWSCKGCTFHNKADDILCAMCYAPKKDTKNTIIDYIIKPWKCSECDHQNIDIINKTDKCQKCKLFTRHSPVKSVSVADHDSNSDSEFSDWCRRQGNKWVCTNCEADNYNFKRDRCKHCQYRRPKKIKHWTYDSELIVFGYCRRIQNLCNVYCYMPFVIKTLIQKYLLKQIGNFDAFKNAIRGVKCNRPLIDLKRSKKFECKQKGNLFQVMGEFIATNNWMIYRWRFKLSANSAHECEDNMLDVGVGIICNDDVTVQHGIAPRYSKEKYCPLFRSGDMVTMEVNMLDKTLSYGINDDWYGVFRSIPRLNYRTYFVVRAGVTIEHVDVMTRVNYTFHNENNNEKDTKKNKEDLMHGQNSNNKTETDQVDEADTITQDLKKGYEEAGDFTLSESDRSNILNYLLEDK